MEYDAKSTDVTKGPEEASTKAESDTVENSSAEKSTGLDKSDNVGEKARSSSKLKKAKQPPVLKPNRVRQSRIDKMMSKAELARRADLSVLTIDRVEKGFGCRMHTKRKILEALGLSLADRVRVFGEEE